MKLYKLRSLADCESAERVEKTLESGKFWCSRFWEMNDPMEGIYKLANHKDPKRIDRIFNEKLNRLICCFSGHKALHALPMWGYYADGFKGVAIEIDIQPDKMRWPDRMQLIQYRDELVQLNQNPAGVEIADEILRRKSTAWNHEHEWRFITEGDEGDDHSRKIGEITCVIIGYPYPKASSHQASSHRDLDARERAMEHRQRRVGRIIKLAKRIPISIRRAQMIDGKLEITAY